MGDQIIWIILMLNNVCLVCGFPDLEQAPYDLGCATFVICPCCGTEFGNDDFTKSHHELREEWINEGMKWWDSNPPPKNWNPHRQLRNAKLTD